MANYRRVFLDGHSYFITMVTHQRQAWLIEYIDLLRQSFRMSRQRYRYTIDAVTILPDHLHMIITPAIADQYPKIVSHIKRNFVYGLPEDIKEHARATLTDASYRRKLSGI